jgi:aminoglycoside phosphotransferase (APT) family kinase protein
MRENLPREVPLALVHGDVQPGNVLVPEGSAPVVIDWEFSQVGDPRQDLGYFPQVPMPPLLYHPDPEKFCALYRERTGMAEQDLNPLMVDYFLVLGTAHLQQNMLMGAEAVAQGEHRGIMGTYLIIAITHFHNLYLNYSEQVSGSRKASA